MFRRAWNISSSFFASSARSSSILVSKSFNLPTVRLVDTHLQGNPSGVAVELKKRIMLAPQFYQFAPIVIDAEDVANKMTMAHIDQIYKELHNLQLQPVGVTNLTPALQKEAQSKGITIITVPKGQTRALQDKENPGTESNSKEKAASSTTKMELGERREVLTSVRSGQQFYARGPKAQLIILGNVSSGAEVLSDGDIHIHGALLGRALAGINGDEDARIYTKSMQAELVAIGGMFTSGDALPDPIENSTLPCMAFISDKKLSFALASQF